MIIERTWNKRLQVTTQYWEKRQKREYHLLKLKRTYQYDISFDKNNDTSEGYYGRQNNGDEMIKKIRELIDRIPIKRSEGQKKFHENFLKAVAPGLYRDKWNSEYARVLRENKWDPKDQKPNTIIITPRRFGKTTAVAHFTAPYALAVPGSVQAIFSTGKRVSTMILEQIKKNIKCINNTPDTNFKIGRNNEECIFLEGANSSDTRKIYCFPSNEKVLPFSSFFSSFFFSFL